MDEELTVEKKKEIIIMYTSIYIVYNYASNSIHYYPFSTNTSKINEDL